MKTIRKTSKFMQWGLGNEATLAHMLSWTLKCATQEGESEYGKALNDHSKRILFYLLFGEGFESKIDEYSIKGVKNWREWQRVDILSEVILVDKNQEEIKFALFVELKLYTHTSERQLESYKKASENYGYVSKGFKEKFVLLGVWEDAVPEIDKEYCQKQGFMFFTFKDVLNEVFTKGGETFKSSGNAIFDEFWTGYW